VAPDLGRLPGAPPRPARLAGRTGLVDGPCAVGGDPTARPGTVTRQDWIGIGVRLGVTHPGHDGHVPTKGPDRDGRPVGRDAPVDHSERKEAWDGNPHVVQLDLVPLAAATLKEAARLAAAVEGLARELDQLTAEAGELRETNRLLNALLGQLGCPDERR
jgi:hypothetical protein